MIRLSEIQFREDLITATNNLWTFFYYKNACSRANIEISHKTRTERESQKQTFTPCMRTYWLDIQQLPHNSQQILAEFIIKIITNSDSGLFEISSTLGWVIINKGTANRDFPAPHEYSWKSWSQPIRDESTWREYPCLKTNFDPNPSSETARNSQNMGFERGFFLHLTEYRKAFVRPNLIQFTAQSGSQTWNGD